MSAQSLFPQRWLLIGHHPVPFDGPASFQRRIATSLLERGCRLEILTYGHNPYADIAARHPDRCVVHLDQGGRSRRCDAADFVRACRRLWSWRPDGIFCTFSGFPDYLALLIVARLLRIRSVVTLHGTGWVEPAWKTKRYAGIVRMRELWFQRLMWWARRAGKAVTLAVFHSADQRAEWETAFYRRPVRTVLAFAPIDGERFKAASASDRARLRRQSCVDDSFAIGTVGRLSPDKGFDVLIRAFTLHHRTHPSSRLTIVGDGVLAGELKALAEAAGVGRAVTFAGATSQPERFYAQFDVFVLSSRAETLGIATLEAMACGVPCIVSGLPGPRRLAGDGRYACVVAPEDPVALAGALDELSSDAAMRADFAARGLERAAECMGDLVPSSLWAALGQQRS